MIERKVTLINKLGLHARAAAKLVKLSTRYKAEIELTFNGQEANCKSIMDVLVLGAPVGSELDLRVSGEDEQPAMDAVCELISGRFGEDE